MKHQIDQLYKFTFREEGRITTMYVMGKLDMIMELYPEITDFESVKVIDAYVPDIASRRNETAPTDKN